jgi:protein tyrosine phosphatase (PTP) superfamily phosphohydrolase (DUF442 family)
MVVPQPVRQAVKQHGVKAGIAEKDFKHIPYRRITIKNRPQIIFKMRKHASHLLFPVADSCRTGKGKTVQPSRILFLSR